MNAPTTIHFSAGRLPLHFAPACLASSGGDPTGVSVNLASELAKRLAVPVKFVTFTAAGRAVDAMVFDTM